MKKTVRNLTIIFSCLLILLAFSLLGRFFFLKKYTVLNGRIYSWDAESLDLSSQDLPDLNTLSEFKNLKYLDLQNTGLTLGEHQWLTRQLPDCEIKWQVQFQDQLLLPDAKEVTVTSLSDADVIALDFLPELQTVHAENCRDYGPLALLMEKKPDCRIFCSAEIGGKLWNQDTKALTVINADMKEIEERLPVLKNLKVIGFTGILPGTRELNRLKEQFPDLEMHWQAEVLGELFDDSQESLDLSAKTVLDSEYLTKQLLYFPYLKTLDLRGVILSEEEREMLQSHYPQLEILFDYELDGVSYGSDTELLDLSGKNDLTIEKIREMLRYFPELKKLILCDCGLSNEELQSLDDEYENIKVIWNVMVGGRNTRTDETYFAPNKWGLKMTDRNIEDLKYCRDMICVDIGHSEFVTNCRWAENMKELRFLVLADGSVRDLTPLRNLKKLQFLELFLIPSQDLTPLQGCTALEDLNLCYVYADPTPIKEMTWLKRLWWSGCWPAENMLSEVLTDTQMNFHSSSSTGEGWREGHLYYEMRDLIGMGYMKG